ncbi:hypothetical protein BCR33DRAFT_848988 [Rhizoclosmatium globosum]|uniref:Uncharacterized protein n=1 Tax=Rhizoclosmatium globosum TaxID=329046 RepID=A0A1Y2CJD5_9FUNG|nr:hypothetical protein BCR33DRAFT_848988 [Rhizoclosmatium globosum]|eukprot:ORY46964.1 hypothetical protein BCR33DRAFT_848988 [Rhizoclosmatium globosum]
MSELEITTIPGERSLHVQTDGLVNNDQQTSVPSNEDIEQPAVTLSDYDLDSSRTASVDSSVYSVTGSPYSVHSEFSPPTATANFSPKAQKKGKMVDSTQSNIFSRFCFFPRLIASTDPHQALRYKVAGISPSNSVKSAASQILHDVQIHNARTFPACASTISRVSVLSTASSIAVYEKIVHKTSIHSDFDIRPPDMMDHVPYQPSVDSLDGAPSNNNLIPWDVRRGSNLSATSSVAQYDRIVQRGRIYSSFGQNDDTQYSGGFKKRQKSEHSLDSNNGGDVITSFGTAPTRGYHTSDPRDAEIEQMVALTAQMQKQMNLLVEQNEKLQQALVEARAAKADEESTPQKSKRSIAAVMRNSEADSGNAWMPRFSAPVTKKEGEEEKQTRKPPFSLFKSKFFGKRK